MEAPIQQVIHKKPTGSTDSPSRLSQRLRVVDVSPQIPGTSTIVNIAARAPPPLLGHIPQKNNQSHSHFDTADDRTTVNNADDSDLHSAARHFDRVAYCGGLLGAHLANFLGCGALTAYLSMVGLPYLLGLIISLCYFGAGLCSISATRATRSSAMHQRGVGELLTALEPGVRASFEWHVWVVKVSASTEGPRGVSPASQ